MRTATLAMALSLSPLAALAQTLPPFCTDNVNAMSRTLFLYCNQKRVDLGMDPLDQGRLDADQLRMSNPLNGPQ